VIDRLVVLVLQLRFRDVVSGFCGFGWHSDLGVGWWFGRFFFRVCCVDVWLQVMVVVGLIVGCFGGVWACFRG